MEISRLQSDAQMLMAQSLNPLGSFRSSQSMDPRQMYQHMNPYHAHGHMGGLDPHDF